MEKTIREKELCIEKFKISLNNEEKEKRYLEEQINEYKSQIKQINQMNKDLGKDKEKAMLSMHEEITRLKIELNKQIETKAKETVNKDMSLEELKQANQNISKTLSKRNEEVEKIKVQLSEFVTRQNELEHDKLQSNLDWQRKYQYLEKMKAKDSEQFTQQILESRDQVFINNLKFNNFDTTIHKYF